ncbi:hypothetical protein SH580_08105 [Coraliomargarita algicola]|uniref:HEAT repeat domain-containing protein n=1 Tax=Coraliomargarita algicola TaxID=3092156 RepID=A0ABZ0RRD6_9BACT|nr:hypothetical protein [Coraliomargarita sp. J2-16]WPJ97671.1 hypothetical protein SH580_08105 [Coraliomargarita sp. J2-16]
MKKSTVLLGVTVWSVSLLTAYYIGSRANEASNPSTTTPIAQANRENTQQQSFQTVALTEPEEANKLEAFFDGEALSLEEMLREIPTLSAEESRQLLTQALAMPKSDPKRARLINELLSQIAETEPMAALELATQIDSLRDYESARVSILEVWGRNDPAAAIAWAATALENEPSRSRASQLTAIYRGYALTNPEAAFQQALTMDENARLKNRLLGEVLEAQIENGGLEAAKLAVDLVSDPDMKDRLRRDLVSEWAEFDPSAAAEYVVSLGDEASADLKNALIREWAESSPAEAAAWLDSLDADDPAIARASASIIEEWTRYDLAASAEWLNSLEASPELDRAVITYTFSAAAEDPASAMTWAESIDDDRRRTWMMERVAATWKEQDTESFSEYLDSSELTEEQRTTLENAENRGGPGGGGGRGPGGGGRGR